MGGVTPSGELVVPHPGTLYGQSQTPISGLKAVPGAHGIVYRIPWEVVFKNTKV